MYTCESNIFRGSKSCVVFRSKGAQVPPPVIVTEQTEETEQTMATMGENSTQLEPFSGNMPEDGVSTSSRMRLSELRCFLCHEKLGSLHSNRIGRFSFYFLFNTVDF